MDVYVIPLAQDRYELYCESPAPAADAAASASTGWLGRLRQRFAYMVHAAETREPGDLAPGATWWDHVQERMMAWVAERIAEQRLLWNLRHESEVRLVHPADVTSEQTMTLVRRMLKRDHDRHRWWLVVNTILLTASAVLAIVPGPNMVAYYFAFRVVGHWFSMRGAARGLGAITWTGEPSPVLSELRTALSLDDRARSATIDAVALKLGLPRLGTFVDRLATR